MNITLLKYTCIKIGVSVSFFIWSIFVFDWEPGIFGILGHPEEIFRHLFISLIQIITALIVLLASFGKEARCKKLTFPLLLAIVLHVCLYIWIFIGEDSWIWGVCFAAADLLYFMVVRTKLISLLLVVFIIVQNIFAFYFNPSQPVLIQYLFVLVLVVEGWRVYRGRLTHFFENRTRRHDIGGV